MTRARPLRSATSATADGTAEQPTGWDEFAPAPAGAAPRGRGGSRAGSLRALQGPDAPGSDDQAAYRAYLDLVRDTARRELAEEREAGSSRAAWRTAGSRELRSMADALAALAHRLSHGPMSGEVEEVLHRPELAQCVRALPELAAALRARDAAAGAPQKRYAARSIAGLYVSLRHRYGLACSSHRDGPAVAELGSLFEAAGWLELYGRGPDESTVSKLIAEALVELDPHRPAIDRIDRA